jgi:hypothetical protein
MKRAGFDEATIQGYIVEQRIPDWVSPQPYVHEFDEDDEDDDD